MEVKLALLEPNRFSRPQVAMKGIKGICVHWVANPMSTAINNRNYFNNLKNQNPQATGNRYASSHEIIGLNGEIIVCVPDNEVAYHAGATTYKPRVKQLLDNSPNRHLYGIEVCHPDWVGEFNIITYLSLVNRVAYLLNKFNLKPSIDTIWRHFDVTGKDCPKYYVQNPKAWDNFIEDVTSKYNDIVNPKPLVSDWALDAYKWVIENNISDGTRPKDPVTREELWTMLYRFKGLG